ncbi:MAG: hypothetical protein J0M04_15810 [Verrucomicrobia bacterium]|nr:hypothetical protein [Verrucomicrobiota bacterium]
MQGFFSRVLTLALAAGLFSQTGAGAAPDDELRKNIVVLVDSSKSVDPANRESALKLVAGLATGKVDEMSRVQWKFQAAPSAGYPIATVNLERLMDAGSGPSQPIAATAAKFVINPLGNYARVAELRAQLGQPRSGTPDELAAQLASPAVPFASVDNSTHIALAEAVVAEAFLKSGSQTPYYLVVISDFNEDCLNKDANEYLDPAKMAALKKDNASVHGGTLEYYDGNEAGKPLRGKYSVADVGAIRFLREKITDLLIGEFIYRGTPMPKHPVHVKIYSPMVKRGLKFSGDGAMRWILPDPAPGFSVTTEGLDMNAPLDIKVVNLANQSEKRVSETCSFILARGRLEVASLLEKPEIKAFLAPGRFRITISAGQAIGMSVDATTELEILKPTLKVDDPALDASTAEKPFEFPLQKELLSEKVILKLDPPPTEAHKVLVQSGQSKVEATVKGGSGEVGLEDILKGASGDAPIRITASLPLPPTAESLSKDVWLVLPQISIWAVQGGQPVQSDQIVLTKERALSLKASHAGMDGMEWRGTTVTGADHQPVTMRGGDENNLDFSDLSPGVYTVKAKFGSSRNAQTAEFTVTVPKNTPWMLIALGAMVVLSLGLFGWHFIRR